MWIAQALALSPNFPHAPDIEKNVDIEQNLRDGHGVISLIHNL